MRRRHLLAAAAAPLAAAQRTPAHGGKSEFSVVDFGAQGDGKSLNTKAIQSAIDACHAAGGGKVILPQGTFVTGTIRLKSRVTLRIDAGARLQGSRNSSDYPKDAGECDWHPRFNWGREFTGTLLYSEGAEDIGIEGTGTIDGSQGPRSARVFPNPGDAEKRRPMLVRFRDCKGVRIRDITLTNPASFTTLFVGCSDLLFDGVRVRSRETGNGDGFDFDGCERVRISNCDLDTGDDAIGLKTFRPDRPNRDFVITNCVIRSTWAAVRIGPESIGDQTHIAVSNCVFRNCRDGFKIQSCEGAAIEKMVFSNIVMEDVLRPFFVTLNVFSMSKHAPPGKPPVGILRDMHVSNIRATVPKSPTSNGLDQSCFAIVGLPGHAIEDVSFTDLHLTMPGSGTAEQSRRLDIPELLDEKLYPEAIHFEGELPASGIYLRHVRDVRVSRSVIRTASRDARAFLAGDDLEDITLDSVTGNGSGQAAGLVKFANARDVSLVNCRLRVDGRSDASGIREAPHTPGGTLIGTVTPEEQAKLAAVRR